MFGFKKNYFVLCIIFFEFFISLAFCMEESDSSSSLSSMSRSENFGEQPKEPEPIRYVTFGDEILPIQNDLKTTGFYGRFINWHPVDYPYRNGIVTINKISNEERELYEQAILNNIFFSGLAFKGRGHFMHNSITAGAFSVGQKNFTVFSLFDGNCGFNASRYLSENFLDVFANKFKASCIVSDDDIQNRIKESFFTASAYINTNFSDQGSSAITLILENKKLYIANLGNSRALLCKNGRSIQLSKEHLPGDPIERLRILNYRDTIDFFVQWKCQNDTCLNNYLLKRLIELKDNYLIKSYITRQDLEKIGWGNFYNNFMEFLNGLDINICINLFKKIEEIKKIINFDFGVEIEEFFRNVLKFTKIINKKNGKELFLSRAFGNREFQPALISEPEINIINLTSEDEFIILGNDELFRVFKNQDLVNMVNDCLRAQNDLQQICDFIIDQASMREACDNIAIFLIYLGQNR